MVSDNMDTINQIVMQNEFEPHLLQYEIEIAIKRKHKVAVSDEIVAEI